jgi:hypothetical protein
MIPPHYQLGCTVVVCPSRVRVVPSLIPGLAVLFSSYNAIHHHSKMTHVMPTELKFKLSSQNRASEHLRFRMNDGFLFYFCTGFSQ